MFGVVSDQTDEKINKNYINNHRTLLRWFCSFRNADTFSNYFPSSKHKELPLLLSSNQYLVKDLNQYCKENIAQLCIKLVYQYLHTKLIPNLVEKIKRERNDMSYSKKQLFEEFNIKKLTVTTRFCWMHLLGYQFNPRKKCYYVDTHESPENVAYCNEFIERYFEYELCCFRWVCISAEERDEMVENGEIDEGLGYAFSSFGVRMYEFHVDDHYKFQEKSQTTPFGGFLSICEPPEKPILFIIGQDECIFKQFIFSKGVWVHPDGVHQLVPKDEGQGLMLSSFCCRELGYGYQPSDETLKKVNRIRKDTKYHDEEAAITKNGNAFKQPLTKTPFVRELDYGTNKDGYWSYEHMVIQLEDCVDVLKTAYPDFQFLFLFDHSNGHNRYRPNGLNINKISIKFGGKQLKCVIPK